MTANGGDVKRQHAGPRANVDRRSDASTLQSGFARRGRRAMLTQRKRNWAQYLSDHRHRCGGLADAGTRESFTKCLDGWLSRPQTGPLPPYHGADPAPRALGPVTMRPMCGPMRPMLGPMRPHAPQMGPPPFQLLVISQLGRPVARSLLAIGLPIGWSIGNRLDLLVLIDRLYILHQCFEPLLDLDQLRRRARKKRRGHDERHLS